MTITEIAELAGVSIATVSRVYNKKNLHMVSASTRARVEKILEEYSYNPDANARRLITGRSRLIGFQVPSIRTPIVHSASLEEIARQARMNGYGILVDFPGDDDLSHPNAEEDGIRYMLDQGAEGLIWQPRRLPSDKIMAIIHEHKAKVLWFRPNIPVDGISVKLDEEKVGELAAQYLLSCGLKRFYAFVDRTGERFDGFRRVILEAGFPEPERLEMRAYTQDTIPDRVFSIIDSGAGIFSYFARFASVLDNLRVQKGLEDCRICSYGDELISKEYGVRFPVISSNADEIGYHAFHTMQALIEGEECSSVQVKPKLLLWNDAVKHLG